MTFHRVDNIEDAFWRAGGLREGIGAAFDTMYYSTVPCRGVYINLFDPLCGSQCPRVTAKMQRLHQLGQFKEEQGNLTADALYKKFQENLTVTHGEQLSKTYVGLAIRVWETILKCRQCRSMLMIGDEVFGKRSPFNSLYKLEGLMQATKSSQQGMRDVPKHCFDSALNLSVKAADMSLQALTGRNTTTGKGCLG